MNYLIRGGIEFYRSHLSRTIFSSYHCAFPHDTCSHYALNAFQHNSWSDAIQKTKARLKRCGRYGVIHLHGKYSAKSGIEEIVQTPQRAEYHVEQLVAAQESKYVYGHVLQASQHLYTHRHKKPSTTLDHFIEKYDVAGIQPRIRDVTNYRSDLRKAAALQSLTPLPLLALGFLPFIYTPLLVASVAVFISKYWLSAERSIKQVDEWQKNP